MLKLSLGTSGPLGVSKNESGIQFCFYYNLDRSPFLCLYDEKDNLIESVNMSAYRVVGNVCSVIVEGIDEAKTKYDFLIDGKKYSDSFMKCSENIHKWGSEYSDAAINKAALFLNEYDWGEDCAPHISHKDEIAYLINVRGYTKHHSSRVLNKGTFRGVIEKSEYLNNLGINQLFLMPAYDFKEVDEIKEPEYGQKPDSKAYRINYWGFSKANYFIPKPEYSSAVNYCDEFRDMVKKLHSLGIEIIMQFYFPGSYSFDISRILTYWIINFHIDGFHLISDNIDIDKIRNNPYLSGCKLYFRCFSAENDKISNCFDKPGYYAVLNDEYKNTIRSFLKSDSEVADRFINLQKRNGCVNRTVNYVAFYDGFTLYDTVSYDYKHNEANGEDNRDGNRDNFSWNCGIEGQTRKTSVNELRIKQIKNAFTMLFSAAGTPLILGGDEFMNSKKGNNNSYCQDNEIGWVNWNNSKAANEITDFVRRLIDFRKNHEILHYERELLATDESGIGFPELSYHGEQAWYYDSHKFERSVGMLFCSSHSQNEIIYIAYNVHWEKKKFGLPKLPKGKCWTYAFSTDEKEAEKYISELQRKQGDICVNGRSIAVFISKIVSREAVKEENYDRR